MKPKPSFFIKYYHLSFVLAAAAALFVFSIGLASNSVPSPSLAVLVTKRFASNPVHDGWIVESGENTNIGKTADVASKTLIVGDDEKNRQYVSVLSFNTSLLPDNAVITSARLRLKKQGFSGSPFNTLGNLVADIRNSAFSLKLDLQLADFSAAASEVGKINIKPTADPYVYTGVLNNTSMGYISKVGVTQFRLRFTLDDDNDFFPDTMRFFSGNVQASAPLFIVTYYIPLAPVAPQIISPLGNAACTGTVQFAWNPDPEPTTEYYFEYSSDSSFTAVLGNSGWIKTTSYPLDLAVGTYYWRVQARNLSGVSAWSPSLGQAQLNVGNCPPAPVLLSPSNGAVEPVGTVNFVWNSAQYAAQYKISYAGVTSGDSGWINETSYSLSLPKGDYQWSVTARSLSGEGPKSEDWSLKVANIPAAPTGISPVDSTLAVGSVTFTWSAEQYATEYYIEYSGALSGNSGWISETTFTTTLDTGGAYTWCVKARNADGSSPCSSPLAFTLVSDIVISPRNYSFVWSTSGQQINKISDPPSVFDTPVYCSSSSDYNQVLYWRTDDPNGAVTWRPNIVAAGNYDVYIYLPDYATINADITDQARYYLNGITQIGGDIDQNQNKCSWYLLGKYYFDAGATNYVRMPSLTSESPYHLISADGMKFRWSP